MPRHPKRPRDMMQLAKLVGEIAVGDAADHVWKLEEVVALL